MGTMMHLVTRREEPLAVLSSGNPRVEQGSPSIGRILLLHRVTPEPVSNNAHTLTPPKEISALGREYSGREALKQFRAVRHVSRDWGMSRLKAIPRGRFPMPMGLPDKLPVPVRGSKDRLRMGHGRIYRKCPYHVPVKGRLDWL